MSHCDIILTMSKPQNILDYYATCNKLKDTIRTGWKKWNVKKSRLESVAEHVYGTQMLALAMYSEYNYDIDILKVIFMLAVHEIGETAIGDFTPFDISREEKEHLEHEAVRKVLGDFIKRDEIEKYFLEFDAHETPEAKFAYQCDKLEAELQCKIYDEGNYVDLHDLPHNEVTSNAGVQELIQKYPWSKAFILFDRKLVNYDKNFLEVSRYAIDHKIKRS